MSHPHIPFAISALLCMGCLAVAQEKRPTTAAVQGIKGVKEDAVAKVKSDAQGVSKINGVETINGVKVDGRATVTPAAPIVAAGGNAVPAGGGTVGSSGTIQSVHGVSGINTARLQNLEAALLMKQGGGTPAGTGAEKGGKGKFAAAALLGPPLGKPEPKAGPKEDGRAGFQEFEKLQNSGS